MWFVNRSRRNYSVTEMRAILLVGLLVVLGCNARNVPHVTANKTVEGAGSAPWPSGCLVTAHSRTQRIIALYGLPCEKIQIGDKAVFNHKGDNVLWINDIGYTVRFRSNDVTLEWNIFVAHFAGFVFACLSR